MASLPEPGRRVEVVWTVGEDPQVRLVLCPCFERVRANHGVGDSNGGDGDGGVALRDSRRRRVSTHSRVPPMAAVPAVRPDGLASYECGGSLTVSRSVYGREWSPSPQGFVASSREDDRVDASRSRAVEAIQLRRAETPPGRGGAVTSSASPCAREVASARQ